MVYIKIFQRFRVCYLPDKSATIVHKVRVLAFNLLTFKMLKHFCINCRDQSSRGLFNLEVIDPRTVRVNILLMAADP